MANLAGLEALIKITQERVARLQAAKDYAGANAARETLASLFEQRNSIRQAA